jgi:hypothetical protein
MISDEKLQTLIEDHELILKQGLTGGIHALEALRELRWYRRWLCGAHQLIKDKSDTQYGCPCCAAVKEKENEDSVKWHNAVLEAKNIIQKVGWTSIEHAYPEAKAWLEKYFPNDPVH